MAKIPKEVKSLALASFFSDIASEMTFPLLPFFMAHTLGLTQTQIGFVEGVGLSTIAFFMILSGYLSDKIRIRKPLILAGYITPALSKPILALSRNWTHMIIYRFLDRTGKGLREPPRDALIASVSKKHRGKYFGFQRALDTSGAVMGVLAATILLATGLGYRAIFWISIIPASISAIIIALKVKERKPRSAHKIHINSFGKSYWLFLATGLIFGLSSISYAFLLLQSEKLGVSIILMPIIYLLYNITYAASAYPIGIASDKVGRKNILFAGFALFSIVLYLSGKGTASPWILMALYGIVIALTDSMQRSYVSDLVAPKQRASALGLYHAIFGIAMLPGNALFGYVSHAYSQSAAFNLSATLAALSALTLLFTKPKK